MSDVVREMFHRHSQRYDALRRRLIPCFDEFYGGVLTLIGDWNTSLSFKVLDLGAGTGMLSAMILMRYPQASVHLIDAAPGMLDQARKRFGDHASASFELGDMSEVELCGPYDLVVSALAIHHLSHDQKRNLFTRIRRALRPRGLFINAEQVLGSTDAVEERQNRIWLDEIRAAGLPEQEIKNAQDRMKVDQCATSEEQQQWMRDAGLDDVDCSFRSGRFAILSGGQV